MQLFITDYVREADTVTMTEERVVHQLTRVLRAKVGDTVCVQQCMEENGGRWRKSEERLTVQITDIGKIAITGKITHTEKKKLSDDHKYLAVALPNKPEKMELIVQKCTEIGVAHIMFFPGKHSILKELSDNKQERLEKIALEAVEQSWGWIVPEIGFCEDIFSFIPDMNIFIGHQEAKIRNEKSEGGENKGSWKIPSVLLIWPEGGRNSDEEEIFSRLRAKNISFGETVLRTETAAIIGGRRLKNND